LDPGTAVVARIDGLDEVRVELVDQRDSSVDPWPWPLLKK
jgi:hypothetical protein